MGNVAYNYLQNIIILFSGKKKKKVTPTFGFVAIEIL